MGFSLDFWLRVFGDFMTGFGRSMLIPFMLIYLKQEGGFATWVVTLLAAVPQFFQLFSTSWGGVLADAYGRKPVMFLSLFSAGVVLTLMGSSNYPWVYAGYVLFLILSNFYRPAAMAMVTEVVPVERQREAFTILRMMANLGFALGPLVGSLLFFSHRSLAVSGSVTAYLLTACTVFLMHESGSTRRTQKFSWAALPNPLKTFSLLNKDRTLFWAVLTGVLFLMVQVQAFSSLTIVVEDAFRDNGRTFSYLLVINTIGVVALQYFITLQTQALSIHRLFKWAIFFAAAGWALLLLPLGPIRYYFLLVLVTVAEMLMAAGYNPFIAALAKEGEVAQYMSFTQTSIIIGQMVGPTFGALGYDFGGQKGYVLVIEMLLLATVASLRRLKKCGDSDDIRIN